MALQAHDQLLNLSGKRVIVTGGGVGIGFGIAWRLAEAGAQVMVADISQKNLDQAKAKFEPTGWHVAYTITDVSKEDSVIAMCQITVDTFGGIDVLVNNAGIYPFISAMDLKLADFERVLAVNLKGAFFASQTAAKQMIAQGNGGRIINITSIDALHPSFVGLAHYDASKHGLWGLTKNLALELAKHNIWVNAIAPGGITTPGTGADGDKPAPGTDDFLVKIPMKRFGHPDEIGTVALFLASDMSSYMTGSQLVVDGGVLLS